MAISINTIRYGWETYTGTVSGSVGYTFPSKSIYIAETSSRTFVAADVHFYFRDSVSGTTITSTFNNPLNIGLWIDNNYVSSSKNIASLTTGDHLCQQNITQFAPHFATYFTGSNHVVQIQYQNPVANSLPVTNLVPQLILTYQYDDSSLLRGTKTVTLPLPGHNGYTSTAPQIFGSASAAYTAIPILDTYLPETNKTYRDIYFEVFSHDASNATTANSMSLQLDSGSIVPRSVFSSSLNTSVYSYDIYNVSGVMSTSAAHNLKAASRLANRFNLTCALLNITYEYDYSASTQIMNSLILPSEQFGTQSYPFSTATRRIFRSINLFIPETNPVLRQSALVCRINTDATVTHRFNFDSLTTFSVFAGSVESGPYTIVATFTSESLAQSATPLGPLTRGQNRLNYNFDGPTTHNTAFYQYCVLNYVSDNLIPGKHNRSIYVPLAATSSTTTVEAVSFSSQSVDRLLSDVTSSYYLNGVVRIHGRGGTLGATNYPITHQLIYTGSIASPTTLDTLLFVGGDSEYGIITVPFSATNLYKTTPYQQETATNPKMSYFLKPNSSNRYWWRGTTAAPVDIYDWATINNFDYPVSCSLLNCNYPSETYKVSFYISGSEELINTLSISGSSTNKSASFDWYDNFQNLYAVCYSPERGISNITPANSGLHQINFSASFASFERSYTYVG